MLRQITAGVAAGFLAVAALAATVAPGSASTFFGWRVADVSKWDTLNVRAWPSSGSKSRMWTASRPRCCSPTWRLALGSGAI